MEDYLDYAHASNALIGARNRQIEDYAPGYINPLDTPSASIALKYEKRFQP